MTPRVVLAGASGHGRLHLRGIVALEAAGRVEPVGVCETGPLDAEARRLIGDRPVGPDLGPLPAGADIGVVSTPIHTHVPPAHAVLDAGLHLLPAE
ncbi:hypothetical protein [Saccharothrix longispora]|uniref:hypothetical protein n=1 Tax=Saccharothrix longispora TaxID=33920 RepID=UPI0028FCFBB2|nr:hypothetical protein [Saccharothrix longispora]MBY8850600.1 hypothetical protein [Saccharothrix sp. MB29]MDU0292541.1 hypothetical protein [Saccharothrix longispora]